jgi:hypothetical protein
VGVVLGVVLVVVLRSAGGEPFCGIWQANEKGKRQTNEASIPLPPSLPPPPRDHKQVPVLAFGAAGPENLGVGWKSKEARVLYWIAS